VIRRLLRALFGCRHDYTYSERRDLHGVPVMHRVCWSCGHASPTLRRVPSEHRRAYDVGAVKPLRIIK